MKKSKKMVLAVCGIIMAGVILFLGIYKNSKKTVEVNEYSFSEMTLADISIDNNEEINSVLKSLYVENDEYCGFTDDSCKTVDLESANAVVNIAYILPECDIDVLKDKFSFLASVNIENYDLINLMYYVEICQKLDISIDYYEINNLLSKYYDEDLLLFFIDNKNDSINIKIIATAMVKRIMRNNVSDTFKIEEGVKETYSNYKFTMDGNTTLYNSGGDILYCIDQFDINDIVDKSVLSDWFEYWTSNYETMTIESTSDALFYSEFLKVAKIFDKNYTCNRLTEYYKNMSIDEIKTTTDLSILYNILCNVDNLDNKEFNTDVVSFINNIMEQSSFIKLDIDAKSTVYGFFLADISGFTIDKEKLENYIKVNRSRDLSEESTYEKVYNLYYNLILEQLINEYDVKYDKNFYQSNVNELLNQIDYSDEMIVADIISTRRLVEIVSDLKIFGVEINLSKTQVTKIKKGINKILDNDTLRNSVLVNDVFVINQILSLNMISSTDLYEVYHLLTVDGGTKAKEEADILSTYQFFASFSMINDYENLEEQKNYINSSFDLNVITDKNDNFEIDLSEITYGIAIREFECGGDKDDSLTQY